MMIQLYCYEELIRSSDLEDDESWDLGRHGRRLFGLGEDRDDPSLGRPFSTSRPFQLSSFSEVSSSQSETTVYTKRYCLKSIFYDFNSHDFVFLE